MNLTIRRFITLARQSMSAVAALAGKITCSTTEHRAKTINVADHGVVPGKDVSREVNQLLEILKGKEGVTVYFPKGTYEFKPDMALEKYRAVTNHDNSNKHLAFLIFGFKNFTLDGGGSTFLFHGRICPFTLDDSSGVTLKNFTIDWDTPFHHELKVVERNEDSNSFVAEISPMKYGFEIRDGKHHLVSGCSDEK